MNIYAFLAKGFQLAAKSIQELHYVVLRDKVLEDYYGKRTDKVEDVSTEERVESTNQLISNVISVLEQLAKSFAEVKIEPEPKETGEAEVVKMEEEPIAEEKE